MKISETILVQTEHKPGSLAKVLQVIADHGLVLEGLHASHRDQDRTTWEVSLEVDPEDAPRVAAGIRALEGIRLLGTSDRVFTRHQGGKIRTISRVPIASGQDLRELYTPGVARVCLAIQEDPSLAARYTALPETVAIVTNGTAVLGLGDIGAVPGLPVMEGKAALLHQLAGLSGVPLLLDEKDPARFVEAVVAVAPSFGQILLEDIAAPACFEIEDALRERLDKPVIHDDQHGTAVVTLAAILAAVARVDLDLAHCTVGQIGLGAAGLGIARLLHGFGVPRLLGTDLRPEAREIFASRGGEPTDLEGVMAEADVVVATTGVAGLIRPEMVREGQVILALSNPDPEIEPELALSRGARYAADGKSVNNVLGFPGLLLGARLAGAVRFVDPMLLAAARTLADLAPPDRLVPDALDREVHQRVAAAVEAAALDAGAGHRAH